MTLEVLVTCCGTDDIFSSNDCFRVLVGGNKYSFSCNEILKKDGVGSRQAWLVSRGHSGLGCPASDAICHFPFNF